MLEQASRFRKIYRARDKHTSERANKRERKTRDEEIQFNGKKRREKEKERKWRKNIKRYTILRANTLYSPSPRIISITMENFN